MQKDNDQRTDKDLEVEEYLLSAPTKKFRMIRISRPS